MEEKETPATLEEPQGLEDERQSKYTNYLPDNQILTGFSINPSFNPEDTKIIDLSNITVPKFPFHYLPEWFQELVKEHSESYNTPAELWAMAFLSGISAGAGKKFILITGNYENYPQIWLIVVGKSGTGKSEPIRVAYKRLSEIDEANYKEYLNEYKEWSDNEKQGNPPTWKQSLMSDTTFEALSGVLSYSVNGVTVVRDELSGWFNDFGRYNKSGEIGHYLSIFDNQTFTVNRKHDLPQLITEPFLNICGTIQPKVLEDVLNKNNAETSGFAQRFLYLYPDFPPRNYQRNPTKPNITPYNDFIDYLNDNTFDGYTELTADAEAEYERYFNDLEIRKSKSNEFWSAVCSKAQIQVLRLALTVKIARLPEKNTGYTELEDIKAGIGIMEYLIYSLQKFKQETTAEVSKADILKQIQIINPNANQTELGEALQVSQQYVSKIFNR